MIYIMEVICCYCKKPLGWKDGKGQAGVSHGTCPACLKIELEKIQAYHDKHKHTHGSGSGKRETS